MSKEERILTPEECYKGAHDRIISLAEAVIKAYPRTKLKFGVKYKFDFDPTMTYTYHGTVENKYYPDGYYHLFVRQDDETARATKYSDSPTEII